MKGLNITIAISALLLASAGAVGALMNTKRARMRRLAKKTGRAMYAVGTVLRTLSCQGEIE
jgi:hypothetical protein